MTMKPGLPLSPVIRGSAHASKRVWLAQSHLQLALERAEPRVEEEVRRLAHPGALVAHLARARQRHDQRRHQLGEGAVEEGEVLAVLKHPGAPEQPLPDDREEHGDQRGHVEPEAAERRGVRTERPDGEARERGQR